MKINNLNVNAEAIGDGIYDIICEKGEEAIVAFGMIPKWSIDMLEKMIREKIVSEAAKQVACTPAELLPIVDKKIVDDMTCEIVHEVTLAIYGAASKKGKLLV